MRARARGSGSAIADAFAARIVAWQRAHGRHDLPWQQTRDAYRIWLSEVMLQQTQVATVLPYYRGFVAAFPAVSDLASAPIGRVLELWSRPEPLVAPLAREAATLVAARCAR